MLRGMGERTRGRGSRRDHRPQLGRYVGQTRQTAGDDDSGGLKLFPRLQRQRETVPDRRDCSDAFPFHRRHQTLLKPEPVSHEQVYGHGLEVVRNRESGAQAEVGQGDRYRRNGG